MLAFTPERRLRFTGLLYRALNPIFAREPLSGEGARLHGGRFNAKGMPALYTAVSLATAIREANQVGTLQPTTIIAIDADIAPVFDATDATALAARNLMAHDLAADDWRERMLRDGEAPTQRFARALKTEGFAGILVPSYARGAGLGDLNLVLWTWGDKLPTRLTVVDDERRLK